MTFRAIEKLNELNQLNISPFLIDISMDINIVEFLKTDVLSETNVDAIVDACIKMGSTKTGALIVIERTNSLDFLINTGDAMNAQVNEVILESIFFKNMKVRRIYDAKSQTLMYVSYSTKETSGSYKHSLSTVPLWGTKAYLQPTTTEVTN